MSDVKEPDYETACTWWDDLPNIWTPLGWRDHMCRFNVLWEGTIVARPDLNRRTEQWKDQGVQVSCSQIRGGFPGDNNVNTQGWNDSTAPVLWTERFVDGILYRQEAFAHVPGGREVERGDEPLFAWIRLSVADIAEALPLEDETAFDLAVQGTHLSHGMSLRNNTRIDSERARYPRSLAAEGGTPEAVRIVEPDGRVRIGLAPCKDSRVRFLSPTREDSAAHLIIEGLKVEKGRRADILLPMMPVQREVFDLELALGYERALDEAGRFWERNLENETRFETPEEDINDVLRRSVRFSLNQTEKNPATGKYCKISGTFNYTNLWTTPGAMDMIMLLDMFGYHDVVARCLDIFREEQGKVVPPGPAYGPHPGYLSTPALYKSIDWLSDNGAVLWTICRHALLSGDGAFAERFTDCIVKSCQWIKDSRALTGHGGYDGVLPAAVATDHCTQIQSVWASGWNYMGLRSAVKVLKNIGHPRAGEFEKEAAAYRRDYISALRDRCGNMPTWTDQAGRRRRFAPTSLSGDRPAESRHAFYLDGGPLFHVFSGLLPASDPLMQDTLAWFREGPQRRYYRHDADCWQAPALDREISSCEPCYSWNVFHTWQLGDRQKLLEGMYSLFAGAVSRKTRISCETRGGVTGNVFAAPLALYLARLTVIDDEIEEDRLHLLRLMPAAWLEPAAESVFEKMPTVYGPVTLKTAAGRDGKSLDVAFQPAYHTAPAGTVLHAPPGLKEIRINGKKATPERGLVELSD